MENFFKNRWLLSICFLVFNFFCANATEDLITQQITISVTKAGTLPDKIGTNKKGKITNLKLKGEINGTDIAFLRSMMTWSTSKLSYLDLLDAKIVEGGEPYYHYVYELCTKNDVI